MIEQPGYYRYPTTAQGHIIFVSEDDLWRVPLTGGTARRLTAGWGTASRPLLSPDGNTVAFVGREEGDNEIYIMPAQGGPITRLTYLAANTQPVAFSSEGDVIISSNAGQPFRSLFMLYRVPLSGGEPKPLNLGPANNIAFGPNQLVALGRNTADPARWKRYRGGTRGQIWIGRPDTAHFERLDGINGNLASPMWIGSRLYFISDHEGYANIYSTTADGGDLRRHTDHETYYVRNASTDGRVIVYHAGADLYVLDPAQNQESLVPIAYYSQRTQAETHYVPAADYWTEYQLSEQGDHVLITTRGKLYYMGNWEGPCTPLGVTQGVRYRLSRFIPGQDRILTVSDDGGEEGLELIDVKTGATTRLPGHHGEITALTVSANGAFAAFSNERHELWLVDLGTFSVLQIDASAYGPVRGIDFSKDSQWLAYALHSTSKTSAIKIHHIPSHETHTVTQPVLVDQNPVFDPSGRYLYFLSHRVFNPVYDNLRFDLGFPSGMMPYAIPLQKDRRSPFQLDPHPLQENGASAADSSDKETPTTIIDFEDIASRVVPFPVREGIYHQLACDANAVYWTMSVPHGSLQSSFFDEEGARATLQQFSLKDLKEETLASHVNSFTLSADRTTMAIRSNKHLRIVKSGEKTDDKTPKKPGRANGYVDWQRIVVSVNRPAEWNQMLREAWRLMRDNFWAQAMSGLDWEGMFLRYQRLLPRVATRSEFSDVVWEMQGELGTSHAYEMGGDYRAEPHNHVGLLAADWEWDTHTGGYKIVHIVRGDSAQVGETSPLAAPGTRIEEGDILLTVDHKPLAPDLPPLAHLVNQAGQEVALELIKGSTQEKFSATVVPLSQEMPARYREWVNRNRDTVRQLSQGRLGYVHIPDMGPRGFSEFYRAYLAESERDGLIVDVRFNGGGHVSQLILENLRRQRLGYDVPRHGQPEPYPGDSIMGPIVALTNEYAGSDGDIFSHAFKLMGIGPLVGQRTWGGVIGIWARHRLVDGSITTQPEFSFWFRDAGWGVENYGTEPTIPIENTPWDYAQHHDAQLHRAVQEALDLLAQNPPHMPDFSRKPVLAPPSLPKRQA